MSINKIHVNNSTQISLNDRFTVMQSVGPKSPIRKIGRRRTQSASIDGSVPKASMANRKFLEQLEKKHKMQAALKLKRRSLKVNLPSRQRIRNRIGLRKGTAKAIRLASNGKLTRSNSLSNIATMKADLVQPALRRSNSTSSLAGRLGTRRASVGNGQAPRRKLIRRNNIPRASSRQILQRSNSTASLRRSNSKTNLRRSSSKTDINGTIQRNLPRKPLIRSKFPIKSQQNRRNSSVSSRLGVKRALLVQERLKNRINRRKPLQGSGSGGVAKGRIFKRRNSTASQSNIQKSGVRQERISRPRGRGAKNIQRGTSRTRSQGRNNRGSAINGRSGSINRGGVRGRGRGGRGRGGRGRGISRPLAQKQDIKKEDLDKELDQYMANTKVALDKEMDVFMNNSF